VDALLGRQTRDHDDLDLCVRISDVETVESLLPEFRRVSTGEWPRFLMLEDEGGRCVDLEMRSVGQQDVTVGRIGGQQVQCLSLQTQLREARSDDIAALRHALKVHDTR